MATRMQQRRGTAIEWTNADPILGTGELGYESDTNKFKIGDGVNAWSSLVYFSSLDDVIDGAPDLLNTLNELASAIGDDANFITSVNTSITDGDAATLTSAQSYADTAEADAISTASADATSKADAAIVTSNSYTDTEISSYSASVDTLFATLITKVPTSLTQPSTTEEGSLWYNSSDGSLYVYFEGFWIEVI